MCGIDSRKEVKLKGYAIDLKVINLIDVFFSRLNNHLTYMYAWL